MYMLIFFQFQVVTFEASFHAISVPLKCNLIGGEIFVTKQQNDLKKLENFINNEIKFYNSSTVFTGICQNDQGQWESLSDRKIIHFESWNTQPFVGPIGERPCLLYDILKETLLGFNPTLIRPFCEMPEKPVEFFLRGVCPGLQVDTYFVFKSPVLLLGYIYSSIIYEYNDGWKIISNITNKTIATLPFQYAFPPLGYQLWEFHDSECSDDENPERKKTLFLHLVVDQPGYFCCHNGLCFESDLVCDGSPDCEGEDDEQDCIDVIVPQTYDSQRPSLTYSRVHGKKIYSKAKIDIEVTILDVLQIDEEDSIFEVFYEMNLMWYDPQLKYDFLKTQISGNIIRNTNSIWTPNLVFYHIKNEEIIEKTLHVVKNENEIPELSANHSYLHVREIYSGTKNFLKMTIKRRQTAVCSFRNIGKYPFGTEICTINFYLQGMK